MDTYVGSINIQGYIYPVLNIFALTLVYFYCYTQGLKDGLDRREWSITLLIRFLFFIVGCKLFTVSFSDLLVNNFNLQSILSQRTLIGGLVYGLIAFITLFIYFKMPFKVLDYAIIPMLAGLCIQKVGCFFAGCCYGDIYHGSLAVDYPQGSPVFYSHVSNHLISSTDSLSLPVHPVQLYEAFGYLIAIIFIFNYHKKVKASGSLLLLTLILVLTVRFITNIFRDASSYILLGGSPERLTSIQVTLLALILIFGAIYYLAEYKTIFISLKKLNFTKLPSWPWLVIGFISIALTLPWYNGYELIFLSGILLISLIEHIKNFPVMVWGRLVVVIILFLLLTSQQSAPVKKDSVIERYHSVKFGVSSGKFINSLTFEDADGCDSKTRYFIQNQTMFGFGYSTNKTHLKQNYNGKNYTSQTETLYYSFLGSQSEQWADTPDHITDYRIFGGGVQFREQMKWVGIGVGVNVGNLRLAYQNKIKDQSSPTMPDKGYWTTPILPSAYFRVGPRHILFGEYSYAQNFPSPSPSFYSILMVGTGFGLKNGTELKFGTLTGINGNILSLKFPVGKKLGFEGGYHFGSTQSYFNSPAKQNQFAFSIEYKLVK